MTSTPLRPHKYGLAARAVSSGLPPPPILPSSAGVLPKMDVSGNRLVL